MVFGYARVSTQEQNLGSQISTLQDAGCTKVYTDTASGVRENRKGLQDLMQAVRKGDTVIVYRIDRIFRSLKNMVELIESFNKIQVNFKSLSEPQFDTTSANGKFLLQIFGAVAEFERNLISERTKLGLANARRRKKLLGRPKGPTKVSVDKYEYASHLYENKHYPIDKACLSAGISKTTFYRIDKLRK